MSKLSEALAENARLRSAVDAFRKVIENVDADGRVDAALVVEAQAAVRRIER